MKGLKFLDKVLFLFNTLIAVALLFAYALPFISPRVFPTLSVLSLALGPLFIVNVLFFLYWLFKIKRQLFLSLVVIIIGFANLNAFYKFSASKNVEDTNNISVMSYNIKQFNKYQWIETEGISDSIINFVKKEKPQILAVQEYFTDNSGIAKQYPFKYIHTKNNTSKFGQAIFSTFPIIDSGSVDFESGGNNAIFIDIVRETDTLRIYNAHLESLRIDPKVAELQKEDSQRLLGRIGLTFKEQQKQVEKLRAHTNKSPYRSIICADMNNSAFSYIYRAIKGNTYKDAFKQAGNGFGRSYDLSFFPLRIDAIFVEESITINGFKTYTEVFSDHFAIRADVKL